MDGVINFWRNESTDKLVSTGTLSLTKTMDGMPLIPARGHRIVFEGNTYLVMDTTWYYDDGSIIVNALAAEH